MFLQIQNVIDILRENCIHFGIIFQYKNSNAYFRYCILINSFETMGNKFSQSIENIFKTKKYYKLRCRKNARFVFFYDFWCFFVFFFKLSFLQNFQLFYSFFVNYHVFCIFFGWEIKEIVRNTYLLHVLVTIPEIVELETFFFFFNNFNFDMMSEEIENAFFGWLML